MLDRSPDDFFFAFYFIAFTHKHSLSLTNTQIHTETHILPRSHKHSLFGRHDALILPGSLGYFQHVVSFLSQLSHNNIINTNKKSMYKFLNKYCSIYGTQLMIKSVITQHKNNEQQTDWIFNAQ